MDLKDKKQTGKNKRFIQSFEFALTGWQTVYKDERNFRSHLLVGGIVIVCGLVFRISRLEWFWLLASIFLVLLTEMLNTTFENIVDMVTDYHFHPIGKKIKDVAAGAVLLSAVFAVLIGGLIFIPKLIEIFLNLRR